MCISTCILIGGSLRDWEGYILSYVYCMRSPDVRNVWQSTFSQYCSYQTVSKWVPSLDSSEWRKQLTSLTPLRDSTFIWVKLYFGYLLICVSVCANVRMYGAFRGKLSSRDSVAQSVSRSVASLHHHFVIVTMVLKFMLKEDGVLGEGVQVSITTVHRWRNELGWSSKGMKYCQLIREANLEKGLLVMRSINHH